MTCDDFVDKSTTNRSRHWLMASAVRDRFRHAPPRRRFAVEKYSMIAVAACLLASVIITDAKRRIFRSDFEAFWNTISHANLSAPPRAKSTIRSLPLVTATCHGSVRRGAVQHI